MNLLRLVAQSMGYELVSRNKDTSLNFHLLNLIQLNKIDVVLDIGANLGQFAQSLRGSGFKGEIHSFEPIKAVFEQLQHAAKDDALWHVHNHAMGSEIGLGKINVTQASDLSSILEPNQYGSKRFKKNKISHTETIQISTVDNFLINDLVNGTNKKVFLKTDTQGYDLEVIKGAKQSIKQIRCLLSEISLIPIYAGMPHYIESLQVYESLGFIVTGFYPITREKSDLSVIEMDCVMINKS
ncbi:MAG: FkbM family methyltransferase [Enterobacterales bacterium]|nr:FkbM family methyltransferase [Enterobacterales bacterium]